MLGNIDMLKRKLFLLVFCIALLKNALAQSFSFNHLSEELAISNLSVRTMMQDSKGFIWLGTWYGLFRYDGYNLRTFKFYSSKDQMQIKAKIVSIIEDNEGYIWVGTLNTGIYRFNPKTEEFSDFQNDPNDPNSLASNKIEVIYQDSKKRIWIGTELGLDNYENGQFIHLNIAPLKNSYVYSITETRDGRLLVGTTSGLFVGIQSNNGNWTFSQHLFQGKNPELENFIYSIIEDPSYSGVLWCGTKYGLKRYDISQSRVNSYYKSPSALPNNVIHKILASKNDKGANLLWLATEEGLSCFNLQQNTFKNSVFEAKNPNSLRNNLLHYLMLDRFGLLWIGTDGGVSTLNLKKKYFEKLDWGGSETNVTCFATSPTTIWAGSFGQGLAEINFVEGKPQIKKFNFNIANYIYGIHADADGNLWVATRGNGIIKSQVNHTENYEQFTIANKGISDDYIMSLYEDINRVMWFGTWDKGILRYDKLTNSFKSYSHITNDNAKLMDYPIVQIFEPITKKPQNRLLWLGTRGAGIVEFIINEQSEIIKLNTIFRRNSTNQNNLSSNFINCIYKDKQDRIWVGTEDGLNLWDPQKRQFTIFNTENGLPDECIQSIQEDNIGNFWVSSLKGIAKVNLESNGKFKSRNFDKKDGLPSSFFHSNSGTSWQNWLFFGSNNGISLFSPAEIQDNTIPPLVALVDFKLFNQSLVTNEQHKNSDVLSQSIGENPTITLQYNQNVISLEFAALHFVEPNKNSFAYRLLGFNDNWIYVSAKERIAHYTNLPNGKYIFEVKAANNDGVWSNEVARATIIVNPPLWRTWWAYVSYLILFGLAIFWYRQTILSKAKLVNQVKLETFKREQMEEVSQMKLHFFTNVSHELRTPLTLILSPLEELLNRTDVPPSVHDMFKLMHRNATRLFTLINQILDFRKSEENLMKMQVVETDFIKFLTNIAIAFRDLAIHRQINFSFETTAQELTVWIDRDSMEKVFFNLIVNAFKYTKEGGTIKVKLDTDNHAQQVIVHIEDTGIGIKAADLEHIFEQFYQARTPIDGKYQQGTGLGLALAKSITELHKGKVTVVSEEGKGSIFSVFFPLGKEHFDPKIIDFNYKSSEDIANYAVPDDSTKSDSKEAIFADRQDKSTILIVEDNPDIRAFLQLSLQKEFHVEVAENGERAWELAKEILPDLIISDIIMPKMNGLDFCRLIKAEQNTCHIPVILLTARSSNLYQMEGYDTGADAYITKPFNMNVVNSRIHNILKNRERIQVYYQKTFASQAISETQEPVFEMQELDRKFLERCVYFVEKHLEDSEYSIEDMSKALLMSRMQLYRKIKALTGDTPNHFIRTIRLKHAAAMIIQGHTIQEATYRTGFQDLKYFRECFKKMFGMNPSDFALKHKNNTKK
jgi:signal transduction histidine kinase/ligand-binding sensor domain-containing protein/DNA-binding response OmpR family regulator